MIDKIEKSLVDRVGSSILITLFLSFLFTVIFQSYVAKYQLAFLGFFAASLLVSIFEVGVRIGIAKCNYDYEV